MLRRCRRHKELRRCSVQILDNYFGINALGIKLLKSVLTSSVALCTDGASVTSIAFFNNPLCSPFLRVTFRQRTKFGQIFITPILRKTFFIKRKRAAIAYLEVICCGSQHYIYNDSFYTFIKAVRQAISKRDEERGNR